MPADKTTLSSRTHCPLCGDMLSKVGIHLICANDKIKPECGWVGAWITEVGYNVIHGRQRKSAKEPTMANEEETESQARKREYHRKYAETIRSRKRIGNGGK